MRSFDGLRALTRSALLSAVLLGAAASAAAQGPRIVRDGETLQGTLTPSDPTLSDGSHYDLYVYVGTAGETVVFTMRSDAFDAFLVGGTLRGNDVEMEVTDDDSGGGTDAQLTVDLPASGQYALRANSLEAGQTGRYTVTAESIGGGPPSAGGRIRAGETVSGRLDASDPTLEDGSHYDLHAYDGTPGEEIVVTLRSADFDAYLAGGSLQGDAFEVDASDDDGAGGTDAQIVATVGYSGTYVIRANSLSAGETGGYTLLVESLGGGGGLTEAVPIRAGQALQATLAASDPALSDGSHYDLYVYEGGSGESIEVFLASADFDAYLGGGRSPDGAVQGTDWDDDGGGGTNARLRVQTGPDGRYYIRANSLQGGVTGGYTLSIRSVGGGDAPDGLAMLRIGQPVEGRLDASDPLLDSDGTHFDVYGYTGTPGEEVVFTLTSEDFDAYMVLSRYFGDEVEAVAQDDDSGPGLNARIRVTLPQSGTYLVVANSVGPGATGRYALVAERPESVVDAESAGQAYPALRAGTPATGQLAPSDLVLADESFADRYTFQGVPGDEVAVTLRSEAFDAYLSVGTLEGGDFTVIASDDDAAGGTDALVRFTVGGSGLYAIQANSYGPGATGAYSLLVERSAGPMVPGPSPSPDAPPTPASEPQQRFAGKWAPLTYAETGSYTPVRDYVSAGRRLESVAEGLNVSYPLPQNVPISFEECTEPGASQPMVNAFYSPSAGEITFCYELMADLVGTFSQGLPAEQVDEAVTGAYDFIMLHEVGHALTHQLDLPITGREEDVADQFATLALIRQGDKGASAALNGVSYLYGGSTDFDRRYFADEHSLGPQRLFNVQCWILGSDIEKYAWMVLDDEGNVRDDEFALTIERARRCPAEYAQMEKSFTRLLNLVYGR